MKPRLTDTQAALLIKNALEFNAQVVALAALIYNRDLSQKGMIKAHADLARMNKEYNKRIQQILDAPAEVTTDESK